MSFSFLCASLLLFLSAPASVCFVVCLLSLAWSLVLYARACSLIRPGHLQMTPAAILCRLLWRVSLFKTTFQQPVCTTSDSKKIPAETLHHLQTQSTLCCPPLTVVVLPKHNPTHSVLLIPLFLYHVNHLKQQQTLTRITHNVKIITFLTPHLSDINDRAITDLTLIIANNTDSKSTTNTTAIRL